MKISIDEEICKKNGMELDELALCLFLKLTDNIPLLFSNMIKKGILVKENKKYLITQRWADVVDSIILDSDEQTQSEERLDNLTVKLQAIFPSGKKEGTSQYWKGNRREIGLRLKKFFKLYGNTYTDEQILEAAESYVKGFNGRYSYMRVLKYFIWKDDRRTMEDGEVKVIEVSDLANYIENAHSIDTMKEDWTSTIN